MTMRRVNAIWRHPLYQTYYRRLEELEQGRPLLPPSDAPLLDTAPHRLYPQPWKPGSVWDREVIYAAAILHDIGKIPAV